MKTASKSKTIEELQREFHPVFERYDIVKAFFFLSLARGEETRHSDIDLILVRETTARYLDRFSGIFEELNSVTTGRAVELFIYTPQELESMADRPFIRRALMEGIVLYKRTKKPGPGEPLADHRPRRHRRCSGPR